MDDTTEIVIIVLFLIAGFLIATFALFYFVLTNDYNDEIRSKK